MSRRMMVSSMVLLFSFGLMCVANVLTVRGSRPVTGEIQAIARGAQGQGIECASRQDVARAIYKRYLAQGFTKKEIKRINVSFSVADGVVTLRGFVSPTSTRASQAMVRVEKAIELARNETPCVKKVDSHLTAAIKPGCKEGEIRCGETGQCVSPPEECNAGALP